MLCQEVGIAVEPREGFPSALGANEWKTEHMAYCLFAFTSSRNIRICMCHLGNTDLNDLYVIQYICKLTSKILNVKTVQRILFSGIITFQISYSIAVNFRYFFLK